MPRTTRNLPAISATMVVISSILVYFGCQHIFATSGQERLEKIRENTSVDNPLTDPLMLTSFRLTSGVEFGVKTFNIDGEVMNKGTETRDYVQITATFYDANKSILGSEFTFTEPTTLQPSQSAPFKISLLEENTNIPIDDIDSIKMHIE